MPSSVLIFCTVNKPIPRAIQLFTVGYAHAAQILNYGKSYETWLDSRTDGGVKEREPERNLHSAHIIRIPWDIEPGSRQQIGLLYNWKGPIAIWWHFRWSDPNRRYCDQMLLVASRLVGVPVCNPLREDKVSPIAACDMFWARTLGMTGKPPELLRSF